jgi:hypothetical protein
MPGLSVTCGPAFWRAAGRLFPAMMPSPKAGHPLADGFLGRMASLRSTSGSALLEVGRHSWNMDGHKIKTSGRSSGKPCSRVPFLSL